MPMPGPSMPCENTGSATSESGTSEPDSGAQMVSGAVVAATESGREPPAGENLSNRPKFAAFRGNGPCHPQRIA